MAQFGWKDSPRKIKEQVNILAWGIRCFLVRNLVGIYIHGSLAFGCFNPDLSDIDILAVTQIGMNCRLKRKLIRYIMDLSLKPAPIDIHFLDLSRFYPWHHPAPYDLHYSEEKRLQFSAEMEDGSWEQWNDKELSDPALASYITALNHTGVTRWGEAAADVFPDVPANDLRNALIEEWCRNRQSNKITSPVHKVLSGCRLLAFLHDGRLVSKDTAGEWARKHLPGEYESLINAALAAYRGIAEVVYLFPVELRPFFAYLDEKIDRVGFDKQGER
ncbi:aminoglycoside adenylyltransferase domain-containing protein [Acidobacteriota bacterium]